jgi:hypothetical protein
MAVVPSDFCSIAESLFNDIKVSSASESCVRTVAGRAYYAAYLAMRQAARDAIGDQGFNIGHTGLIAHLKGYQDRDVRSVGTVLAELKYYRETSDYWPHETVDRRSVGLALNGAKGIVRDQSKITPKLDGQKLNRLHEPLTKPKK